MAIADVETRKSPRKLEAVRLPRRMRGRKQTLTYPSSDGSPRMYDPDGLELRACRLEVAPDGSAVVEYEDGVRASIQVEWV